MNQNIKKISIIGGSGTGKTTLAINLSKELELPSYHIDAINYSDNWEKRDKSIRDKEILEIVKEEKWIIDGTYKDTLKSRLENADLVVYLDYTSLSQVVGVLKRYFKYKGKDRPENPGCKERMNKEFLFWVINWRKNKRDNVIKELMEIDKSKVLIFKNRRKLNKWYYKNFNKKMEI